MNATCNSITLIVYQPYVVKKGDQKKSVKIDPKVDITGLLPSICEFKCPQRNVSN